MGFDKVKVKQVCFISLYVAVLILLLIYSDVLFAGLKLGISIFLPFLIGGAIAFILNIPMAGIENKLFKRWNGRIAKKIKRPVSMVLSIIFVFAIVALVIGAVVPQLRTTLTTLGAKITPFLQSVLVWLESLTTDYPELAAQIKELEKMEFNWEAIIGNVGSFLKNGVGSMVGSTFTVASSIIGGVVNVFIAFVFSIYILSQKEKLQGQISRIIDAYAPKRVNKGIHEVTHRLHINFTNFICGQCLEAVVLGCLFIIFMTIFRMPYAIMIGTLIGFTSLIPIVGAFIGCGVGAFMILIDSPIQALWFVIMFLIIQQLEGNLIYPRVVGNSVGLPSIWVLMSVSVGGSLFGVMGMLMFIPLMSTMYSLLRDDVNRRNAGREAAMEGSNALNPRQERNRRNNRRNGRRQENAAEADSGSVENIVHEEVAVQTEGRRTGRAERSRLQRENRQAESQAGTQSENRQAELQAGTQSENRQAESQAGTQSENRQAELQAGTQHESRRARQERTRNTANAAASVSRGANTDALAQIIAEVSASVQETEDAGASEERPRNNHRKRKKKRPQNTEQRNHENTSQGE